MNIITKLLIVFCSFSMPTLYADTLSNANILFQMAETSYPDLFNPPDSGTMAIDGFYVRYYSGTDIYLGTRGDAVHVYGPDNAWVVAHYGTSIEYVGRLRDFVQLSDRDISHAILDNRRPECTYYADNMFSTVLDLKRNLQFSGALEITVEGDYCVFKSNSIPNHNFNDQTAAFATNVRSVQTEYRVPIKPAFAEHATLISLQLNNAILLNGVKVDRLAAACFGVGNERIGCNNMSQAWRLDPMSPRNSFGTDMFNAHTQPDGAYHYHGNPGVLFDQNPSAPSPVVGFAADGFPVFGSFIQDGESVRAVTSSYRLRSGNRPGGAGNPGGTYDGTYVDDYEYVAGSGDLDECNGMIRDDVYGYYITNAYPWVMNCLKGTPHSSFYK